MVVIPDSRLDDIVVKAKNEGECAIRLELIRVLVQHGLEQVNVARTNC